ncbi:MAG: glycosyl hydrolase [Flavobacteriaceae bacterium]
MKTIFKSILILSVSIVLSSCGGMRFSSIAEASFEQNKRMASNKKDFVWGVNGNPLNNVDYTRSGSIDRELNFIEEHQFTFYRIGIRTDLEGNVLLSSQRFSELLKKASERGIEILPVFLINTHFDEYKISEEEAFRRGKSQMRGFAQKYGQYINYYYLGNEQEIRFINPGSDGKYTTDYDLNKFKIVAAYLKGMHEGVKEIDPTAKAIINSAGWLHFGYYELLKQAEVPYDIMGYHWYSKTDTYRSDFGHGRITDILYERYQKPIWLTEVNHTRGSHDNSEYEQAIMMKRLIDELYNQNYIEGFFVYELYDQPSLKDQAWAGDKEAHFGIIEWKNAPPDYSEYEYKPVSNVLRYEIEKFNHANEDYTYALLSELSDNSPEKNEVMYWTNRLDDHKNPKQLIEDLYKEYIIANNESTIAETYQKLLNRNPTKGEEKYWKRKLRKQNQPNPKKTILLSEEFKEKAIWNGYERRTGYKRL